MGTERAAQTATLLQNGKVLIAGGFNSTGFSRQRKSYGYATEQWRGCSSQEEVLTFFSLLLGLRNCTSSAGQSSADFYLGAIDFRFEINQNMQNCGEPA
jgi:hypothetical protein